MCGVNASLTVDAKSHVNIKQAHTVGHLPKVVSCCNVGVRTVKSALINTRIDYDDYEFQKELEMNLKLIII